MTTPNPIQINNNDIHVWSTELSIFFNQENELLTLLSADEYQRAMRFHFPIHRQRFIVARAILRQILSYYLKVAPQEIRFAYTEHEKPYLLSPDNTSLQFNTSHSEDFAIYAFSLNHPIGIDIEKIQDDYNPAVAERFFSPKENGDLQQLPPQGRIRGFYRIWSRKEAMIKAIGKGLSMISTFSVSVTDCVEIVRLENDEWYLIPLAIHDDYQSALATNQDVKKVYYWRVGDHLKL